MEIKKISSYYIDIFNEFNFRSTQPEIVIIDLKPDYASYRMFTSTKLYDIFGCPLNYISNLPLGSIVIYIPNYENP